MPTELAPNAPLFVVLNAGSGGKDAEEARALITQVLDESKRAHEIEVIRDGADLPPTARRAVNKALAQGGAVVAAGGDGTINTVAQAAYEADCPMGVLPRGTFNYFSRAHGLPSDMAQAVRVLASARAVPIQVGLVGDRIFLVNASLGLYPQLLEDREQFEARFGRRRIIAVIAAVGTLLREHRQLRLIIERRGEVRDVRTPTLFIGNNRVQLEQVGIPPPPKSGGITAVMVRPVSHWSLLRLLVSGAMGRLGEADRVESFEFHRMRVTPWLAYGMRRVKVACDGEVRWMRSPLEFRVSPRPLYLLKPESEGLSVERNVGELATNGV